MISAEECMRLVLERFPAFEERWRAHLEYWEGETPGVCTDLSEFGQYVSDLIAAGETSDLPEVFALIEELMTEGSTRVHEAAATCFLENLQNYVSSGLIPAESFVHLLGEKSRAYCRAWDEFTGVPTPGL
jgi:hypothetical protein